MIGNEEVLYRPFVNVYFAAAYLKWLSNFEEKYVSSSLFYVFIMVSPLTVDLIAISFGMSIILVSKLLPTH